MASRSHWCPCYQTFESSWSRGGRREDRNQETGTRSAGGCIHTIWLYHITVEAVAHGARRTCAVITVFCNERCFPEGSAKDGGWKRRVPRPRRSVPVELKLAYQYERHSLGSPQDKFNHTQHLHEASRTTQNVLRCAALRQWLSWVQLVEA